MESQILKSDAGGKEKNSETTLRQTLTEDRVLADLDRLNIITQKEFKSGLIFIFVIIVICILLKLFSL